MHQCGSIEDVTGSNRNKSVFARQGRRSAMQSATLDRRAAGLEQSFTVAGWSIIAGKRSREHKVIRPGTKVLHQSLTVLAADPSTPPSAAPPRLLSFNYSRPPVLNSFGKLVGHFHRNTQRGRRKARTSWMDVTGPPQPPRTLPAPLQASQHAPVHPPLW